MVCSLRFTEDGVHATHRFVRSAKLTGEEEAGRARYRTFGTAFPGDELLRGVALVSPVNVSVYPFAGRLLAFGEQGLPWELDPVTLETRGEHTFGGRLNPLAPFSAHPGFDYKTGEMLNFGVSFAADRPTLNLYRFDPAGEMVYRKRVRLPIPCSLHDFGLSPRFAVFYLHPHLLDMAGLARGKATVMDCLRWEPERGSELLLVERETGEAACRIPVPDGYCLHQVNAFERDGLLVVDVLELEEPAYPDYQVVPDLFEDVAPAHPVRFVLDPEIGELVERREVPHGLAGDFPAIDPRRALAPSDRFWMLAISATGRRGRKFFDRVQSVDFGRGEVADAWQAPPGRYLGGEPVFAADPESENGVIICQELDPETRRTCFLLFDAHRLSAGPVARIPLRSQIHLGFHACFDGR
jgi:all-trans-8'-apo-beta-carotenal 15,15'-oxygenase